MDPRKKERLCNLVSQATLLGHAGNSIYQAGTAYQNGQIQGVLDWGLLTAGSLLFFLGSSNARGTRMNEMRSITHNYVRADDDQLPIITKGSFGVVRHPFYAWQRIGAAGTAIAANDPLAYLTLAAFLIASEWNARAEEEKNLGIHGRAYADYVQRVPRWLPEKISALGKRTYGSLRSKMAAVGSWL